ncbi:hypothetical protein PV08_04652 [Exophiala spinifera]|uniref:Uncharacterized protein n=1 Tax=Exophiala spinifera TaxID=91928 RepID=A0A0D2BER9_9EURO|nr:uncharacterized protein PV08_04652 [Exophiala spinifera]KIW17458.1 hypothetical protein PV08_04652 [Exophiala spinifera]
MPPKRPSRKATRAQPASSRRRRNDAAADDDGANDAPIDDDINMDDDDDGDGDGESATESANDLRSVEESLKISMVVDTGLRKEQRQRRLETEFEGQVRLVEEQVENRGEERKREVAQWQSDVLARLLALSRRKSDLETQIFKETQELADAYLALKEEFEAVLQGREGDVNEAIDSLNKLEEAAPPKTSS